MRGVAAAFGVMLLCGLAARGQEGHRHELSEEEVGSVHFATTCSVGMSEAAKAEFDANFNKAVALLHSFQYEDTRAAFEKIARENPRCAMAEWGVAMSHFHGLWRSGDFAAGSLAIGKAQQIAKANAATSEREKGYIEALAAVYSDEKLDYGARGAAFEKKMGELAAANPTDTEAQIFHALSLKLSASPLDRTFQTKKNAAGYWSRFSRSNHTIRAWRTTLFIATTIRCWPRMGWERRGCTRRLRRVPRTRIICRHIFLQEWDRGMNRSRRT